SPDPFPHQGEKGRTIPLSRAAGEGAEGEDLADIQAALDAIADRLDGKPVETSRVAPSSLPPSPIRVHTAEIWVTSRDRLIEHYGRRGFESVAAALHAASEAIAALGFYAHVLYVDDETSTGAFGLPAISPAQTTALCSLLRTAADTISRQVRPVEAILIVGGDEIVPFARLPNPTDDDDEDVPSDNPYGVFGRNLFLPDVAVGRLPDDGALGPAFLCQQIEALPERRQAPLVEGRGCLLAMWDWLIARLRRPEGMGAGYASLVWEAAAQEVFQVVGRPDDLQLCPPVTEETLDPRHLSNRPCLYFNLHGARQSAFWYGQKDGSYPADYPMLPIALAPAALAGADIGGSLVYSECCYGANVLGKTPETSLALRFLAEGAAGFVGSTVTSYGVLEPPLSGADLLGVWFWRHLSNGHRIGEALRRARHDFFALTREQQGWLDGDDQKTLLEFVLYGDPLLPLHPRLSAIEPSTSTLGTTAVLCQPTGSRQPAAVNATIERRVVDHLARFGGGRPPSRVRFVRQVHCRGECDNDCHKGIERPTHPHEAVLRATASQLLATVDGQRLNRHLHVTLDRSGQIAKTLVSK
ncbi:MAG: hypothetical protein HYY04_13385, partial [Chloroflexi bacterium]|nr:hypothetical protein [Chloroflexota bacterium]